jgi:hypothetical protein
VFDVLEADPRFRRRLDDPAPSPKANERAQREGEKEFGFDVPRATPESIDASRSGSGRKIRGSGR